MTEQQIIETLAIRVMGWSNASHMYIVWNPLQNIADAWMIVEKMGQGNDEAHYRFVKYFMGWSIHDITPKEICRAAIEAVD